jgi:hypothetical protein
LPVWHQDTARHANVTTKPRASWDARGRGRRCACLADEEAEAYPRAMLNGPSTLIDGRLEDLIVAWARRRWPALRLVPARWMRPAVAPMAVRLRRLLSRAVLAAAMPIGIILALLILKS